MFNTFKRTLGKMSILFFLQLFIIGCADTDTGRRMPEWYLNTPVKENMIFVSETSVDDERLAIVDAIYSISSQRETTITGDSSVARETSAIGIGKIDVDGYISSSFKMIGLDSVYSEFSQSVRVSFKDFILTLEREEKSLSSISTKFSWESNSVYPSAERIYRELEENGVKLEKREEYLEKNSDGINSIRYYILFSYSLLENK